VAKITSIRETSSRLWVGTIRLLRRLDEGLHTTEMSLLAARVERLEQDVTQLKAQRDHVPTRRM
jgi:hypothetical protein